jgi:hypothetical protein
MLSLLALVVTGSVFGNTVLVRVNARNYQELYNHVTFKGTSIDIAGAQTGRSYDLILDESDLPAVENCGLACEVLTRDLEGWRRIAEGTFGQYNSLSEMVTILRGYASTYPAICRLDSFGKTYENRWIYGVRICGAANPDNVPQVLFYAQHHAREWAAGQVTRNIIDTLVRNYATNPAFQNYVNNHAIWVFPVTNPDGFNYDYPSQLWWRKNRHPYGGSFGTDINRDYNGCCSGDNMGDWGALVRGSRSSHYPSDETYMGAYGGFAEECRSLTDFFKQHTFVASIGFHSYSELVLWPYGHGGKTRDSTYYANLGTGIASQVRKLGGSGTYTPQQSNYLYPTNGGSDDFLYGWAHYIGGFPSLGFTMEVGTMFYQPAESLNGMQTQTFKGAWYLMNRVDSITNALHGQVPRPLVGQLALAPNGDYTVRWAPIRQAFNHPDRWELEELQNLSVVTDSFEGGTGNWTLLGATVSTSQRHSGLNSIFLGNVNNESYYLVTKDPYPVTSASDSLSFWTSYNLENNYDVLSAEVSLEGKEWLQLNEALTGNSGGWVRKAYSLAPWLGRSVFIRIREMSDDYNLSGGAYIDDVRPVPVFGTRTTVSSSILDTAYAFAAKPQGRYWYRVRGHNTHWNWGDKGPLQDITVGSFPDVGVRSLTSPAGGFDSGATAVPACTVYNYGNRTETYTVRMRIGSNYDNTVTVASHAPRTVAYVTFPVWTALSRGANAVTCSTRLSGDSTPANDRQTGSVTVRVNDVGCVAPLAPAGTIDSGIVVTPACTVANYGTLTASYQVRMRIGAAYNQTASVSGQAPGTKLYVTFPTWTALPRGSLAVICSTALAGDMVAANDRQTGSVAVRVIDAQAVSIVTPGGTVDSGASVVPQANVRNNGTASATFNARMSIGTWSNTQTVSGLDPGATQLVSFAAWTATLRGANAIRCTTLLSGDAVPANNLATGLVTVRVLDVVAAAIVAPAGPVDSGVTVTPQATVRNAGTAAATFDVRFSIGTWSNTQTVTSLAPGATQTVSFAAWTALQRGTFATRCTTLLAGDMVSANNVQTGSVSVDVRDAEVVSIVAPSGTMDSGAVVTPQAVIRNNGTQSVGFDTRLSIGGWSNTQGLVLAPGATQTVSFANWTAGPRGSYNVRCTTLLDGDMTGSNDLKTGTVDVVVRDVEVFAILAPSGTYNQGNVATPQATVRNSGTAAATFDVRFDISDGYTSSRIVADLAPGASATLTFADWTALTPGILVSRCTTQLSGDLCAANDLQTGTVYVNEAVVGWTRKADMPAGPKGKRIKDGGCLTYSDGPDTAYIYALKGNGRCEYYQYNVTANAWTTRESIPAVGSSGKKKPVKKGATITTASGRQFAAKGNGTLEWWCYEPVRSAKKAGTVPGSPGTVPGSLHAAFDYPWQQKTDIPAGTRACKEGCGAAAVRVGDSVFVYFLKGSATQEFYRYNPDLNTWKTLVNAPAGASGKAYKNGSALCASDDGRHVFVVKGSYNEFYSYAVDSALWRTLAPLPPVGSSGKKKKVKDGAGLAWHNGTVYCLKGGGTHEFWSYIEDSNKWRQLEDIPVGTGKPVKGGGALVYALEPNALFAFKGNNTLDFFKYGLSAYGLQPTANGSPAQDNLQSAYRNPQSASGISLRLSASVCGSSSPIRIDYTLPRAGNATVRLYDITGQLVTTLASGYHSAGSYKSTTPLLARGIYVLKLESGTTTTTAKLVIE